MEQFTAAIVGALRDRADKNMVPIERASYGCAVPWKLGPPGIFDRPGSRPSTRSCSTAGTDGEACLTDSEVSVDGGSDDAPKALLGKFADRGMGPLWLTIGPEGHGVEQTTVPPGMPPAPQERPVQICFPAEVSATPATPPERLPPLVTAYHSDGTCCVQWTILAKKLTSTNQVIVSPDWELRVERQTLDQGAAPQTPMQFKLMLVAQTIQERRGGRGFKKARGKGHIWIKFEGADAPAGKLTLRVSVGDESSSTEHDFVRDGLVCKLLKAEGDELWDFGRAVGKSEPSFVIRLEASSR
mmetsp:Transcript_19709/g.54144  ORF Transcript_19709/g.54144 Transcript_19709/m.54144 type:complete len:299 (+) Transcript_19709:79-975(+)